MNIISPPMKVAILKNCDLPELADKAPLISREFANVVDANEIWREIASKIHCPLSEDRQYAQGKIRNKVIEYINDIRTTSARLRLERYEIFPEFAWIDKIRNIVKLTPLRSSNSYNNLVSLHILAKQVPTIDHIDLMQDFLKARDTLLVQKKLAEAIGEKCPSIDEAKTLEETIELAKGFKEWVNKYSSKLNNLTYLDLNNLKLTSLPIEICSLKGLTCWRVRNCC